MSNFETVKSIDPVSGKTIMTVFFQGQQCESFVLRKKISKKYIGLDLIYQDIDQAISWLRNAHSLLLPAKGGDVDGVVKTNYVKSNDETGLKLKAYFYASIITYAKCFCNTTGRGTKLDARDYVATEFMDYHEKIMGFRNGLVAHAGDVFDTGEVIVALHPSDDRFHVRSNLWRLEFEDDRNLYPNFELLMKHVQDRVKLKIDKLLRRIIQNEAKEAVIEFRTNGGIKNE